VQKCGCALSPRGQKRGVRERFFPLSYFMRMNAEWQNLYVRDTKNCCALQTSTENFAALVQLQDFDKMQHFL